jgi:proteasome activator subunit 4
LEDEPFDALRPILEDLLSNKEKNKQRAAADLLAGLLGGEPSN